MTVTTELAPTASPVMTMEQAASYLRISKAHLSNAIKGKIPGVPPMKSASVGRRILIKRSWADEWLETIGTAAVN